MDSIIITSFTSAGSCLTLSSCAAARINRSRRRPPRDKKQTDMHQQFPCASRAAYRRCNCLHSINSQSVSQSAYSNASLGNTATGRGVALPMHIQYEDGPRIRFMRWTPHQTMHSTQPPSRSDLNHSARPATNQYICMEHSRHA